MVVIGRFCCNCSYNICCCFCWYREMLQLEGFAVAVVVAVTGSDVITVVTMMTFALSTFYLSTSLYLLLFLHTFIKKYIFISFPPLALPLLRPSLVDKFTKSKSLFLRTGLFHRHSLNLFVVSSCPLYELLPSPFSYSPLFLPSSPLFSFVLRIPGYSPSTYLGSLFLSGVSFILYYFFS